MKRTFETTGKSMKEQNEHCQRQLDVFKEKFAQIKELKKNGANISEKDILFIEKRIRSTQLMIDMNTLTTEFGF